uniref:Ig-like domain-containing protein n=1 Tax=Scleropages formosus TaxID=113540 RepID=A0A8C9SZQ0_SCLFO
MSQLEARGQSGPFRRGLSRRHDRGGRARAGSDMVSSPALRKMDFSSDILLRLHWILTVTTAAVGSSASTRIVTEGEPLTLSCRYSIKRYGPSSVCWGRGCGALWCSGIIVQTDGSRVVSKVSEKYRLAGDLQSGLVDLTITNVSRKDKGPYCCRVDIDGYFNDKKVFYTVTVVKGQYLFI